VRAVTRVNVKQASKYPSWVTTLHNPGEVRRYRRSERHPAGEPIGVVTTARMARVNAEQEKPAVVVGCVAAPINGEPVRVVAGQAGGGWARSTAEAGQCRRREGALIDSKRIKRQEPGRLA
jgi:hypothetical protein